MISNFKISPVIPNVNKSTGVGKIVLQVDFNNSIKRERVFFSTSLLEAKDKFKNGKSKNKKINSLLADEINFLQNSINELKIKGIKITASTLKDYRESQKCLGQSLVDYIKDIKEYKLSNFKNKQPINYDTLIFNIEELQKRKKCIFNLIDINQQFLNDLVRFFKSKNLRSTTIKFNYLNVFKAVLNQLHKDGIIDGAFRKFDFGIKVVESELPTLTDEEIQKLGKYMPKNRVDQRVKDLAMIQIFTGLRISDLRSLTKENFSDGNLKIRTKKTNSYVAIKLVNHIVPILEKYDYNPAMYLNFHTHNFNYRLKKILKELEIDRSVEHVEEINGNVVSSFKKIHEVISSHDLRRTAITVLSDEGWTTKQIMAVTGHTDDRSVNRYIKVDPKVISEKMEKFGARYNFSDNPTGNP